MCLLHTKCHGLRLTGCGRPGQLIPAFLAVLPHAPIQPVHRHSCSPRAVSSPTDRTSSQRGQGPTIGHDRRDLPASAAEQLQETTSGAVQAAADFINTPAVAMVALNLGAALFGSNQARNPFYICFISVLKRTASCPSRVQP